MFDPDGQLEDPLVPVVTLVKLFVEPDDDLQDLTLLDLVYDQVVLTYFGKDLTVLVDDAVIFAASYLLINKLAAADDPFQYFSFFLLSILN